MMLKPFSSLAIYKCSPNYSIVVKLRISIAGATFLKIKGAAIYAAAPFVEPECSGERAGSADLAWAAALKASAWIP